MWRDQLNSRSQENLLSAFLSYSFASVSCCTAFAATPLEQWSAPWRAVQCMRFVWDIDMPLANLQKANWDAGRAIASVGARWPDASILDLTNTVVRSPFEPSDFTHSVEFRRLAGVFRRQIRQPDGNMFLVTENGVQRAASGAGQQPDLISRPNDIVGYLPPVLARWVDAKLSESKAVIAIEETEVGGKYEIPELSVSFAISMDDKTRKWYLSGLGLLDPSGNPWWRCEFSEPKPFGKHGHLVGTIRTVQVRTSASSFGGVSLPPSPGMRHDRLLNVEFPEQCSDKDYIQNLEGVTVSIPTPVTPPTNLEIGNRSRDPKSFGLPVESRSEDPPLFAWILAGTGALLVALGIVFGVRRRMRLPL